MNIRNLKIERFGDIRYFEAVFPSDFVVITGKNSACVASAIQVLTGGRPSKREASLLCSDAAKLYAEVETEHGERYCVEVTGSAQTGQPQYRVWKPDGQEDRTEEYLRLTRLSEEEALSNRFSDFQKHGYPNKLKLYRDPEAYYPDGRFGAATDGVGTTKTFRSYLKNYIRAFEPQSLGKSKEDLLILEENGACKVINRTTSVDRTRFLSESETAIYHYLCFLNLSEFWYGIGRIKDLHHIRRPFVISGLAERIDRSVDITEYMLRTRTLGRQIFLILPCGELDRLGRIEGKQVVGA